MKAHTYFDYLESIYDERTFNRKLAYIDYNFRKFIPEQADVLEIGPGMGEFIKYLNDKGVRNIDVVDFDGGVLDYIKRKYKIRKQIQITGENLHQQSSALVQYDVIFMLQVLEHVKEDQYITLIQTLYSILKPGGSIIITVPNGANPLSNVERYSDITHVNLFSENSFKGLVHMCNLKGGEFEIRGYKIPPLGIVNILRIFMQKALHLFLKLILIINGGVYFNIMEPNISLIITKNKLPATAVN